jgi:hypothetical protein
MHVKRNKPQRGSPVKVSDVAEPLWVARLIISEATRQKLSSLHGLDWRDVNEAVVGVRGLDYFWHDDPGRGRRAIVEADAGGRRCTIVLYPVEDPFGDAYALGSAYPQ